MRKSIEKFLGRPIEISDWIVLAIPISILLLYIEGISGLLQGVDIDSYKYSSFNEVGVDNIIYIVKRNHRWHVWLDSTSNNFDPKKLNHAYFMDKIHFRTKEDAILYAFDLKETIGYVEYGVSVLN